MTGNLDEKCTHNYAKTLNSNESKSFFFKNNISNKWDLADCCYLFGKLFQYFDLNMALALWH